MGTYMSDLLKAKLRVPLFEALDRAVAGGYGDFVKEEDPEIVATDVMDYDRTVEEICTAQDFDFEEVATLVEQWQKLQKK
jgi:hypothetical protein